MFDNKLQDNGSEYYKFATITVRVFVDKNEVDQAVVEGYQGERPKTEDEAFNLLADEKINALFPTEHPIKHYETNLA